MDLDHLSLLGAFSEFSQLVSSIFTSDISAVFSAAVEFWLSSVAFALPLLSAADSMSAVVASMSAVVVGGPPSTVDLMDFGLAFLVASLSTVTFCIIAELFTDLGGGRGC